MIEPIALVRFASVVALSVPAGSMLIRYLRPVDRQLRSIVLVLASLIVALLAGLQIVLTAEAADPASSGFDLIAIWRVIGGTRTGTVLAGRVILALATSAWFAAFGARRPRDGLALCLAGLFLFPISGHASTASPHYFSLALHGVHAAAAGLWIGGLLSIASAAWPRRGTGSPDADFKALLARFSPWALGLVLVAMASGTAAAVLQVGRPAALFGTPYGQLLILKVFILLPLALLVAAWLRFGYLRQGRRAPPVAALALETGSGLAVMLAAAIISQGVPGRHDDIVWPLPFQFDWARLWTAEGIDWLIPLLLGLAAVLVITSVVLLARRDRLRAAWCFAAACAIPAMALIEATVPAYPTTFAASPSRYEASSLASAATTFQANCASCHGQTGRGDGPSMSGPRSQNADLTASHTGDHTAGDLYWWISHGTPSGLMPGFAGMIDEAGRWDLVNYVRLLTASRRASALTGEVAPGKPWLAAIDFDFIDSGGDAHSLRDYVPVSPVLLVIGRNPGSMDRLGQLRAALPQTTAEGLIVIFVCGPELADACTQDAGTSPLLVLRDNTNDIVSAWTAYRYAAADADRSAGHMEFLIDRFGYVRARWQSGEGPPPPIAEILRQTAILAAEPQLRPPPEELAH